MRALFSQGVVVRMVAMAMLVLVHVLVFHGEARAEGLRIHVRGTAKITARASRDQGDLVMSGALTDDAGQPLPSQEITVHVARESDAKDARASER